MQCATEGRTCAIKSDGSTPTDVVLASANVVLTSDVESSGIGVVGDVGSRDGTVGTVSSKGSSSVSCENKWVIDLEQNGPLWWSNVLAFNSDNPGLNPAGVYIFLLNYC